MDVVEEGQRERKTVVIDSLGLNPLSVAHGERKEPHKGQGSVAGKRWGPEQRGWRGEKDGEVSFKEQLLC